MTGFGLTGYSTDHRLRRSIRYGTTCETGRKVHGALELSGGRIMAAWLERDDVTTEAVLRPWSLRAGRQQAADRKPGAQIKAGPPYQRVTKFSFHT